VKEKARVKTTDLYALISKASNLRMTKVGGHGVATVKELLKEKAIIQKFAKPSQIYKEYKPSEAETFFNNPKYKAFYENVVDLGDKGKENMKLVAEELNIDLASLFSLYEYVGSENTLPIIKLTKTSFQEDQSNLMIKPLLPIMVDEQEKVYKVLQQMISIRNMPENVLNQPLSEFVELLTSKHDLLNNLWQDYKEIWKKKAPKAFKTNETQYYLAKSRQQIWILMAIFKGLMTGLFKIDDKMFLDMFKVFKEQQFRGSLSMDLPEVEGSPLQKEITDGFDAVKHMSALLLTASLKLGDILRLNPKQLLSNQSSAYTIVTRTSDEIFKGMAELEEQDFPLTVEVSYFSMAMYTAVDSINLVLSFQQDQILEDMHKRLTDTLRRNNSTSYNSYEKGIDGLFASEVYNFFTPIEKDLVKNCMKDFFTLLIIPKTPGTNVLEKSNDSEIDFIANTIFKIIDTPKDLEEFWSKFDKDFVYGNSMPTVFSNFLDMFPHKAELTIKFATNILGSSRGHIYVQNVIDLFANMSKYTLPEDSEVLKKVQYEELGSHESELPTYVLTEDYEVPNSNGFIIPANTTFIMTETKNIKFSFKYNYWNVFWKSITAILAESVNKNIAFTGAQFKFIKLICKMIMLEPFAASDIQLMMLTPSSDIATLSDARVREAKTRGYAGLAMIFFECLNLCKTSNDNISTVYWIIKAVNSLMISDISTELIVVSQIYPLISQEEQMGGQIHVFASIMEIFRQKYYGRFDKPSNLLAELVQLTETVILKSDYLYENFPPKDYLSHLSQVRVGNDQVEISEIANHYLDMQNGGYWSEEVTKKFNERVFQSARSYIPGSKLYPSTLVPDLLELVLIQAMDLVNNNTAVNFEDCPETRLIIKARVFSILDSLAARFKVGSGAQLLTSRSEGPYICLNYLAEFFKSINFSKFLMSNFDVEINPQDVFFGVREPSEGVNGLGLENKLYLDQVLHSKNQTKTTEAFQTMMVEVTKCFETICQLVLESVRDPTSPAARLTFVAEFKAYLLTVEDFYKNLFSNFSQEYSANFFIMLMALADFNNEKEVNSNLTLKLHSFEMPISSLTPQSLFFMDSTKDYPLMFSHKINQAAILTLGKQEKLLKSNSISTAALHSMYSVLKLWRKANKANKPVLADLLTSGQLSPHFSNKVFEWVISSHPVTQSAC
jgi:hypothetical protein